MTPAIGYAPPGGRALGEAGILLLVFAAVFAFSVIAAPLHVTGDQVAYTKAYGAVAGREFVDGLGLYKKIIFTDEVGHYAVIWLASNLGIGKTVFMGILNGLVAALFVRWLIRKEYSLLFAVVAMLCCYYLYTVFFTLEKLKVAFLFALLYLASPPGSRRRPVFLALSLFSHFQMGILFGSVYLAEAAVGERRLDWRHGIAFAALVLAVLASGNLLDKLRYYSTSDQVERGGVEALQFAFGFLILACSRKPAGSAVFVALILLAIAVFGADRLNMFLYFGFLYFAMAEHWPTKAALIAMSFYFLLKAAEYLRMVILQGV